MGRKEGKYAQTARCIRILDRLRGHRGGVLLSTLATETDANERTVRRDFDALREAGYTVELFTKEVEGSVHRRSAVRLVETGHNLVPFTSRELYTLVAVKGVFDVLRGTPFYEHVQHILEKAYERVPHRLRGDERRLSECFVYVPDSGVKEFTGKTKLVEQILDGVINRRLVRGEYQTGAGRNLKGTFALYTFVMHKQGLYVLGRRLDDDEVKKHEPRRERPEGIEPAKAPVASETSVLAVERFVRADVIERSTFVPPADLDIASYFQDAFGIHVGPVKKLEHVVIEFSKARKKYALARIWHRSQRAEEMPDGNVRLHFDLATTREVPSFILKWGPHAKAIEPEAVVRRVAKEIHLACDHYKRPENLRDLAALEDDA